MKIAKEIMEKTVSLLPELAHGKGVQGLDVVRHNVGLRPSREGGPRVENEMTSEYMLMNFATRWNPIINEPSLYLIATTSGKPLLITHCYGHGGYGK
jgi:hypothetical protein